MKTFNDVYKGPYKLAEYGSWVYDSNSNFVFQFETEDKDFRTKVINTLNGLCKSSIKDLFTHEAGYIYVKTQVPAIPVILIRGWGNLTGIGGMNLDPEEATNIQDTFAEFIVNSLNGLV